MVNNTDIFMYSGVAVASLVAAGLYFQQHIKEKKEIGDDYETLVWKNSPNYI